MANSIQVINKTNGTYYTVNFYAESAVLKTGETAGQTGQPTYYIRVSTSQTNAEGGAIPDQVIFLDTAMPWTDGAGRTFTLLNDPEQALGLYGTHVVKAVQAIMWLVEGRGNSSFSEIISSSSSESSKSSSSRLG